MLILFYTSFILLFWIWMLYPVSLYFFSLFYSVVLKKRPITPLVSVFLTVHNEEDVIERRILNILQTNYQGNNIELVVASDGSTDRTDEIVKMLAAGDSRIALFRSDGGGKSKTQNMYMNRARGEIVIITDAETLFTPQTIPELISNFADPRVGCVSGKLTLGGQDKPIKDSQGAYWRFEMLLRSLETRCGLMHTASGPVMAFRKNLFKPFPPQFGDDCIIPLDVVSQGFLTVHDDGALAQDEFPGSLEGEFRARVRMTVRNITCTLSGLRKINPIKYPLTWMAILSHKVLRWLTPYFMLLMLISNIFIIREGALYMMLFLLQILYYIMTGVGYCLVKRNKILFPFTQIFCFTLANFGFFCGVLKAMQGKNIRAYTNK